jgi:hypothetical protein
MMKTKLWAAIIPLCALVVLFSFGSAAAANGTLKLTFKYKDPATGVEQNLSYGFIYLHTAARPAPMEKYFSKADYILGPTANGNVSVSVPAGSYYVRVLRRKVVNGATRPYGPPEAGDLTWFQTTPITITAGATLDLGTKYATPFGSTIAVTGIVKSSGGVPLAGRYVRATTEPCVADGYNYNINQCGPNKFLALQPTDATGSYRLELRNPGTYYLSTITVWDPNPGCSGYCAAPILGSGESPTVVTVQIGESKTANIVGY